MSLWQRRIYAEDRFKCYKCSQEQCKVCGASPYHTGYNCIQYSSLEACRYCRSPIDHKLDYSLNPFSDLCTTDSDCMQKVVSACPAILRCGHRCYGYKDEDRHICIHPSCR